MVNSSRFFQAIRFCKNSLINVSLAPNPTTAASYSLFLPTTLASGALVSDDGTGLGNLGWQPLGPNPTTVVSQVGYLTANTSATAGGVVPLNATLNNTATDIFSVGVNGFTIARSGIYFLGFNVNFPGALLSFSRTAGITVNGTTVIQSSAGISLSLGSAVVPLNGCTILALTVGQVVLLTTTASAPLLGGSINTTLVLTQLF